MENFAFMKAASSYLNKPRRTLEEATEEIIKKWGSNEAWRRLQEGLIQKKK